MRRMTITVAGMLLLGACGGAPAVDESDVATSADEPTVESDAPTAELPDTSAARQVADVPESDTTELDVEAIVAATVLIASGGDLEAAIDAGIIGEAEAEAALAALEAGSVDGLLD